MGTFSGLVDFPNTQKQAQTWGSFAAGTPPQHGAPPHEKGTSNIITLKRITKQWKVMKGLTYHYLGFYFTCLFFQNRFKLVISCYFPHAASVVKSIPVSSIHQYIYIHTCVMCTIVHIPRHHHEMLGIIPALRSI